MTLRVGFASPMSKRFCVILCVRLQSKTGDDNNPDIQLSMDSTPEIEVHWCRSGRHRIGMSIN